MVRCYWSGLCGGHTIPCFLFCCRLFFIISAVGLGSLSCCRRKLRPVVYLHVVVLNEDKNLPFLLISDCGTSFDIITKYICRNAVPNRQGSTPCLIVACRHFPSAFLQGKLPSETNILNFVFFLHFCVILQPKSLSPTVGRGQMPHPHKKTQKHKNRFCVFLCGWVIWLLSTTGEKRLFGCSASTKTTSGKTSLHLQVGVPGL